MLTILAAEARSLDMLHYIFNGFASPRLGRGEKSAPESDGIGPWRVGLLRDISVIPTSRYEPFSGHLESL